MIPSPQQRAILGLIVFNAILVSIVVHLMFFAAKGPRFTADDGAQERTERIAADTLEREERRQADRDIHMRIDNLHPHTWPVQ